MTASDSHVVSLDSLQAVPALSHTNFQICHGSGITLCGGSPGGETP